MIKLSGLVEVKSFDPDQTYWYSCADTGKLSKALRLIECIPPTEVRVVYSEDTEKLELYGVDGRYLTYSYKVGSYLPIYWMKEDAVINYNFGLDTIIKYGENVAIPDYERKMRRLRDRIEVLRNKKL